VCECPTKGGGFSWHGMNRLRNQFLCACEAWVVLDLDQKYWRGQSNIILRSLDSIISKYNASKNDFSNRIFFIISIMLQNIIFEEVESSCFSQ